MAGQLNRKFIALCSVALGAIYAVGYTVTDTPSASARQPTSQQIAQADTSQPSAPLWQTQPSPSGDAAQTSQPVQPSATPQISGSSSAGSSTSKPAASSSTQKYIDGTYTGSGSNNIGTVQVAVTIKNGKIAHVEITACDTHYSEQYITSLPAEVVATQSPIVTNVSGATKMTRDFEEAVQMALSQAANPNYAGTGTGS